MIDHATWRSLIYRLAEEYPDCLMLNFTIKLISDAGFQSEITSISTAAQQIEVYSRVLKTAITKFLTNPDDVQKSIEECAVSKQKIIEKIFFIKRTFVHPANGLPRTAHLRLQSSTGTSFIPRTQRWFQYETPVPRNNEICPSKVRQFILYISNVQSSNKRKY